MTADSLQKQIQAPDDHLFRKDRSGNPAGRRPGSRNRATLAAEVLLEGEAEAFHRHGKSIVPLPGDRERLAALSYGGEELERACAYRVYQDPADLQKHLDEVGIRQPA